MIVAITITAIFLSGFVATSQTGKVFSRTMSNENSNMPGGNMTAGTNMTNATVGTASNMTRPSPPPTPTHTVTRKP